MKNNKIGDLLKTYRKTNHWSVEDVSIKLKEEYGLNIAEKTIYGWESNQAHPTADTFVALCAGMIIFPACFAYGVQPDSGPNLIFVTLPNIFNNIPWGRLWGSLFFIFSSNSS